MKELKQLVNSKYFFAFIVFFSGIIGMILDLLRAYQTSNFGATILTTSFYFTIQSNFLVTLTSLLFLLKFERKQWFKYLSFITLINILMTAIFFHLLLTPYMENIQYIHYHLHTVTPLLFVLLYFLFYEETLPFKKFYIGIIYPTIYVLVVYIIIELIFGDMIAKVIINFENARYIYPFLDPNQYNKYWLGLSIFIIGIVAPMIILFSLIINWLKHKFNKFLNKTI